MGRCDTRVAALIAAMAVLLGSCGRNQEPYVEALRSTEPVRTSAREKEKTIEELKQGIDQYRKEVDRTVKASENLGVYYRLLAVQYMNRQMYGEALESLDPAISFYPENETLFYYAGVCAAMMSKATVDDAERLRLLAVAEKRYLRALEIYPDHGRALFGLAVLYSMELGRPAEALPLLRRLLERDVSNVEARMLLARTHVALANYEDAIKAYDEVLRANVSRDIKQQARDNITEIESRLEGTQP